MERLWVEVLDNCGAYPGRGTVPPRDTENRDRAPEQGTDVEVRGGLARQRASELALVDLCRADGKSLSKIGREWLNGDPRSQRRTAA